MANQQEIEALYDWLDYFQELRLGKCADLTAAFFDGDFTKTLSKAQTDKHDWVFDGVAAGGSRPRILDIGSGWGPMLKVVKERGGEAVGLTLSRAQARYCQREGLDARVLIGRTSTQARSARSMPSSRSAPSSTSAPRKNTIKAGKPKSMSGSSTCAPGCCRLAAGSICRP